MLDPYTPHKFDPFSTYLAVIIQAKSVVSRISPL